MRLMVVAVVVLMAMSTVGCASWKGSKPLPDEQLLKGCKDSCPPPGFCVHDGVKWSCLIPRAQ